jgi:hypothetical protein
VIATVAEARVELPKSATVKPGDSVVAGPSRPKDAVAATDDSIGALPKAVKPALPPAGSYDPTIWPESLMPWAQVK